jgi:predicted  nucleic acid-binding Zn-ribbon protein
MRPVGRPAADKQPESIEFVPKRELDRAQQENERLRKEIERLKQETERLRRELEAALRASKRQAAPHSRATQEPTPSGRAANQAAATADRHAALFRRA